MGSAEGNGNGNGNGERGMGKGVAPVEGGRWRELEPAGSGNREVNRSTGQSPKCGLRAGRDTGTGNRGAMGR